VPLSLEMMAMRVLPSGSFGILMSLEPAVAALAGLVLLGEHLSLAQWGAVACVCAASGGATFTASRMRGSPDPTPAGAIRSPYGLVEAREEPPASN
jgi:inner membrane transporter RhtA